MTVTGKTLEENLDNVKPYPKSQKIISSISSPIKKDSHLRILKGNLAEDGAVAKITGKEGTSFTGTARVFNSEEETLEAIYNSKINPGDVIVVRYEGPVGGPGMREMLKPTSAIMGKGMGDKVAFITDGRFSGGSHGFVVGHITPEAAEGGLIGLLEDGDQITIDAIEGKIDANLSQEEILKRRKSWCNPKPYNKKGVLSKYARVVSSASLGAITD
jgi:dihydroxy-acid dehydratase